jgi:hypothetical protein
MNAGPLAHLISGRGLEAWREALQGEAAAGGIAIEITYGEPTDNPGVRVDLSSSRHLARVTVWESGACEVEALEVSNGRAALGAHRELTSEHGVRDECLAVIAFMTKALRDAAGRPTVG